MKSLLDSMTALMKMLRDPETEQERKSSTYILFNWK